MKHYDKAPGIRRSDLWVINKSPKHFKHHMESDRVPTKALVFGAAAHKLLLEGDTFFEEYAIIPQVDRRTKQGKEIWAQFELDCEETGMVGITEEDFEVMYKMRNAVMADPLARELLKGDHEKEFYWTDDWTGEECKCKVDCLTRFNDMPFIVDYKTTDSCEDGHFERSARKYGYQFQAGMYCEGLFQNTLEEHGFAFIAQEKTEPYAVRVYVCDKEWIRRGYDKFRELIGIYHNCRLTGNWYGYEGPDNIPVTLMED